MSGGVLVGVGVSVDVGKGGLGKHASQTTLLYACFLLMLDQTLNVCKQDLQANWQTPLLKMLALDTLLLRITLLLSYFVVMHACRCG
jgi:hypothetical protein